MKKILAILLAVLLLVSAVPVGAMAAETPTITAEYTAGEEALKKGDSVEVLFRISNNPGFDAMLLKLVYDSNVLQFTGLKTTKDELGEETTYGVLKNGTIDYSKQTNKVGWMATTALKANNILFGAVFEVVGCGDTAVSVEVEEMYNTIVDSKANFADTFAVTPSTDISVPSVPATEVTLNATSATMYPGDTKDLKTTVTPENSTDEIIWTSSDKSVAIVRNGTVTALQAGTTTITAKANDTVSATCEVTVKNHVHMQQKSGEGAYAEVVGYSSGATQFNYWYGGEKYTMSPNDVYVFDVTTADTVKFGFDDEQFNRQGLAVCKNLDGMLVDGLFFNGDAVKNGKEFAVADIVQYALVSYADVVKAFGDSLPKLNISESDTLAFMCYQDNDGYVMSQYGILLKISPNALVPATKVELDKTELTLKLGVDASAQLTATVTPENTTDKLAWSSDKETVATVDENGKVTPVAAGTAKITATAGNVSASCTVTVAEPIIHAYKTTEGNYLKQLAITGVDAIEYASDWVDDGTNVTTTVVLPKGTPDGTVITSDFVYYWYDQAYMVKSETKTATLENGTAQVTFEYVPLLMPQRDTRTYVVNYALKQEVNSVTLDKTELSLQLDATAKLTATVDPADFQGGLQWTSSASNVATVDGNGNVTAVGGGTADITVTAMGKSATCKVTVVAPFSATNIPSIGSGDIDVTQILVKTDATITDSAWDGDMLNITLAAGTPDGTKIDAEFYITLNSVGDYSFNGNDTVDPGAKKVSATIANGEAEIKGAVGLCTSNCGPSDDLSFTPKTYILHFTVAEDEVPTPTEHTITIADTTNGTVTANPTTAKQGNTVTLTVTPDSGYELGTLTVKAGEDTITVTENKFTMPDDDVTVTATFASTFRATNIPSIGSGDIDVTQILVKTDATITDSAWDGDTLNITLAAGTPDGTKIDAEFYITLNTVGDYSFNGNNTIDPGAKKVSATIANGEAEIKGAVGLCTFNCGPSDDLSFTPKTYILHFTVAEDEVPTPTEHTITIADTTNGTVTANPTTAKQGDTVTLTITPDSDYKLGTLTVKAGDDTITVTEDKFTMPDDDVTVTATFVPIHECKFDQKIASDDYLKSPATCDSAAVYYYSCTCRKHGTETFTSGGTLAHDYQDGICAACGKPADNATLYTIALGEGVTVSAGETVEIPVTIGHTGDVTTYNAFDLTFTYDPAVLKLVEEENTGLTITDNNGTLRVLRYGDTLNVGEVAFTLKFTALTTGETKLTATSALVGISQGAIDGNANKAGITNKTTDVTVDGYPVNLPEDFTGESKVNSGESYTFTAKDKNYNYEVSATMGGQDVTVKDNGDGTFTIENVTGKLDITLVSKTAKSFTVTLDGLTGDATAQYMSDYTATVTKQTGYTYTIAATIGGTEFTGYTYDAETGKVTIPGNAITGKISIKAEGKKNDTSTDTYAVTFAGNATAEITGAKTAEANKAYTFTVKKEDGFNYTVTATMGGNDTTVTETENGYSIANVTGALVITVNKTSEVTVEVGEYLNLNGKSVFLVKANGTLAEGYAYAYDGTPMFRSEAYDDSWVYLVITEGSFTAEDAKAKITSAQATATTLKQTYDVNETGKVDVNDAQLVYDLYNNKYQDFTVVSMQKFLNADTNGDGKVDVNDAAAIVNEINKVR